MQARLTAESDRGSRQAEEWRHESAKWAERVTQLQNELGRVGRQAEQEARLLQGRILVGGVSNGLCPGVLGQSETWNSNSSNTSSNMETAVPAVEMIKAGPAAVLARIKKQQC